MHATRSRRGLLAPTRGRNDASLLARPLVRAQRDIEGDASDGSSGARAAMGWLLAWAYTC